MKKKFHDFYFGIEPKPKVDIAVGDIFLLGDGEKEKDPFKRKNVPTEVVVIAIQEGYVQYDRPALKYIDGKDSMKMDTFLYCYRKKCEVENDK